MPGIWHHGCCCGCNPQMVYKYDADGILLWTWKADDWPQYAIDWVQVGPDDSIYCGYWYPGALGQESSGVASLNPDGTERWVISRSDGRYQGLPFGGDADGNLYYMCEDWTVRQIKPDGTIGWTATPSQPYLDEHGTTPARWARDIDLDSGWLLFADRNDADDATAVKWDLTGSRIGEYVVEAASEPDDEEAVYAPAGIIGGKWIHEARAAGGHQTMKAVLTTDLTETWGRANNTDLIRNGQDVTLSFTPDGAKVVYPASEHPGYRSLDVTDGSVIDDVDTGSALRVLTGRVNPANGKLYAETEDDSGSSPTDVNEISRFAIGSASRELHWLVLAEDCGHVRQLACDSDGNVYVAVAETL